MVHSFNRQNLSNIDPNGFTQVFPLSKPVVSEGNVYVTWEESDIDTGASDAFIAVSNNNGASFIQNTFKYSRSTMALLVPRLFPTL